MDSKRKMIGIIAALGLVIIVVSFLVWKVKDQNAGQTSSVQSTTSIPRQQDSPQKVDQKPVPTTTDKPSKSVSQSTLDSSSVKVDTSEQKEKPGTADAVVTGSGSVRGTIEDVSTSTIIIKAEDTGKELYFMRESAEVTGNLTIGSLVDIFYNGVLDDNNSLDLYVTRIVVYPS